MRGIIVITVLVVGLVLSSGVAHAHPPAASEKRAVDVLPFSYGRVTTDELMVYDQPGAPTPTRVYPSAGTWVSIQDEQVVNGETWYRIDRDGWTPAAAVAVQQPSDFHGTHVTPGMPTPFGFVVAETLNVRARPGVAEDNPPIDQLQRYTVVPILSKEMALDDTWYKIADGRYVHSNYVRRIAPVVRPAEIGPNERWIEVNLKEQTLAAYEGSRMVYATLISSGLPRWQTITGLFRIWVKIKHGKMSGGSLEKGDFYYLADVPWTMYFKEGYGLHAAYWHDNFGWSRSHGCVNLSPLDAYWLFQWATPVLEPDHRAVLSSQDNPGTWVFVHPGTQPEAQEMPLDRWGWLTLLPAPTTGATGLAYQSRTGPSFLGRLVVR